MNRNINDEKPSERALFAIQALLEFERKENCKIRMSAYHGVFDKVCYACLGGAAALKRFEVPENEYRHIYSVYDIVPYAHRAHTKFNEYDLHDYEESLDWFRVGDISMMFKIMDLDAEEGKVFDRNMPIFRIDRAGWFTEAYKLIEELKQAGY